MAVKALARQNGPDVPIEIDPFLARPRGGEEAREKPKRSDKFVHVE
jgi:hypothetical protein